MMALKLDICRCRPICSDYDDYVITHIYNWGDIVEFEESDPISAHMKVDYILKTSNHIYNLSRQQIPTCHCFVRCKSMSDYIDKHLYEIADEHDVDAVCEYLFTRQQDIIEMIGGEPWARLNRIRKERKKAERLSLGLDPVQPPPPPNLTIRNEPCINGINCRYFKCRRLHPEGRTVQRPEKRKQGCILANLCPDKHTGCPFYHNPHVDYYDESIVYKKGKRDERINCDRRQCNTTTTTTSPNNKQFTISQCHTVTDNVWKENHMQFRYYDYHHSRDVTVFDYYEHVSGMNTSGRDPHYRYKQRQQHDHHNLQQCRQPYQQIHHHHQPHTQAYRQVHRPTV